MMASISCPDGDSPNQPRNISFPKVNFGKAKPVYRSFNVGWFDKWPWLHWMLQQNVLIVILVSLPIHRTSLDLCVLAQLLHLEDIKTKEMQQLLLGPMRPLPVIKSRYKNHYTFSYNHKCDNILSSAAAEESVTELAF